MHDVALASGLGQFHSDTSKTPTPLNTITFGEILALAINPPTNEKRAGQWFIPSTLLTRNFGAQAAEGKYWCLWADIDTGDPGIDRVSDVVRTLRSEYLIYSSPSATEANRKWRVIIPLQSNVLGYEWPRYQQVLNNVLREHDLIPDTVNERSAQLCYLPNRGEYYEQVYHNFDEPLDPVTWWEYLPAPAIPVVRPPGRETDNPQFDKYLGIARDAGMILDDLGDGHYTVICPNHEQHSGSIEARLTAPNTENRGHGGFSCFHDHCGHLNIGHLYNHVGLGVMVDATSVFTVGAGVMPPDAAGARVGPPAAVLAARNALYDEPIDSLHSVDADYERVLQLCATANDTCVDIVLQAIVPLSATQAAVCIRQLSASVDLPRKTLTDGLKKLKRSGRKQDLLLRQATNGHELSYINDEFHFIRNGGTPIIVSFGRNHQGYQSLDVSKPAQFRETIAHYKPYFCPRRDNDINAADGWLEWVGKNQHQRLSFEPGKPLIIEQYDGTTDLNTYIPPVIGPVRADELIQYFMGHLMTYTCGGDERQYRYLLQWMADLFQNPGRKPQAGILLAGSIGSGKSIIPLQLGKILGATYLKVAGAGALTRDFNESQASKMLIFYDEANERDSSRLRDRITSEVITINGKGKPEYTTRCYARFMVVSNQGVPIDVTEGDRRFFMPDCLTPPGVVNSYERRDYFAPIVAETKSAGFHAALHAFLLAVDLTGWDSEQFPMTKRKVDMLDEGKGPIDQWIDECQMGGVWYGGNVVVVCGGEVALTMLVESCALFFRDRGYREPLNSKRVSRVLRQRGFVTSRSNVVVSGMNQRTLKRVPHDFFGSVGSVV